MSNVTLARKTFRELREKFPDFTKRLDKIALLDPGIGIANVLVSASLLDGILEWALMDQLRGNSAFKKSLFSSGESLLYHFAPKIKIGFASGIYDDVVYQGLEIVRELRNTVAHTTQILSFRNTQIVQAVGHLTREIWGENYNFSSEKADEEFIHATASIAFAIYDAVTQRNSKNSPT